MQIPNPAISAPDQQHQRPTQTQPGPWFRQGPPGQHQAVPHANSWFFVPLLLAGAHRSQADTEQQWQNDPRAGHEWQTLVATLRAALPIPWRDLHNTLATLQQLAADSGHLIPGPEQAILDQLATAGSLEPAGAQVHLPWVLNVVTYPSGYIPATAQETLLQHFLGDRQASTAANLANRWRHHLGPPVCQPQRTDISLNDNPVATNPTQDMPSTNTNDSDTNDEPDDTTSSTSSTSSSSTSTNNSEAPPPQPGPPPLSETEPRPIEHPSQYREALASLDSIDLVATLQSKVCIFQSPPQFLKGRIRHALTVALEAILAANTPESSTRAWKLWFLLPRMLLHRPPGTRTLAKDIWRARITAFQAGQWLTLLSNANASHPIITAETSNTRPNPKAHRARQLVHQGELSAARQALSAGPLAPGERSTLDELTDPNRRPQAPYQALDPALLQYEPPEPVDMPADLFLTNFRRARKAAAPGPSGLTAETLKLVLDDEEATQKLVRVAQRLASADLPPGIHQAMGLGRLIALQKPNGRVRGIVIGDLLRRLVSRCLAQSYAKQIHQACLPHQYALSTRAGTEAVVHALTTDSEQHPTRTILSVDGIGAYDTISRNCMLQGLQAVPEANRCLPFVRLFYTQPSTYVWHDNTNTPHVIQQAEGGEQGDPLMPALFSLGQHAAIQAVHSQLQEGESLYAYLDDVYAMVEPHRVKPVYDLLAHHLYNHAHIQLNSGKTRVWNLAGVPPPNLESLGADVWVGNPALPPEQRGLTVLGTPLGTPEYQRHHLSQTRASHQALLDEIPSLDDLQASWLLLLYCASPRCNYLLRMLPPTTTRQYAQDHDLAVLSCLTTLLDAANMPATAVALAHLPLHLGGLGLTSATITAAPAYWASWADTLPILYRQAPQQATTLLQQLEAATPATPSIQALTQAMDQLQRHGFEPPSWADLAQGSAPPTQPDPEQRLLGRGWQRPAAWASHQAFRAELTASLNPASQAMLQSQSGPYASRTFTTINFGLDTTYPSHLFRVLLFRRLRLPLPLSARICRCRRILDPLGDHRAACAQAGVLRGRGIPLERAAARVCREAGARVTTNTRLSDLNLDHINRHDDRRIEVIANGLPLWGGAQLAVDTTLVSPLTSSSQPRRRAGQYAGAALQDARKSKERTYPELLRSRRCRLVVLAIETGGRWSPEATTFLRLLAQTKARAVPNLLRKAVEASLLSRWSAILTHAAQHAFAASLLALDCAGTSSTDGDTPLHQPASVRSAPPTPAYQPSPSPPLRSWGLDLAQPFMHIRSRRYRNGAAWRLPSKTVIHERPSARKRSGEKKKKKNAGRYPHAFNHEIMFHQQWFCGKNTRKNAQAWC